MIFAIFLCRAAPIPPKNFVLPVDKSPHFAYNSLNITKLAVMRRVGFRIDPSREPRRWKRAGNREQKMVSELRGRRARVLSPRRVRPLPRPAVSVFPQRKRGQTPQHRGRARKGPVKTRWYHGSMTLPSLQGRCPARTGAFFFRPAARPFTVRAGTHPHILKH